MFLRNTFIVSPFETQNNLIILKSLLGILLSTFCFFNLYDVARHCTFNVNYLSNSFMLRRSFIWISQFFLYFFFVHFFFDFVSFEYLGCFQKKSRSAFFSQIIFDYFFPQGTCYSTRGGKTRPGVTVAGDANSMTIVTMHDAQSTFDPLFAKDRLILWKYWLLFDVLLSHS